MKLKKKKIIGNQRLTFNKHFKHEFLQIHMYYKTTVLESVQKK